MRTGSKERDPDGKEREYETVEERELGGARVDCRIILIGFRV